MRYNLISPRPRKDGKTYWHTVGTAFPRDKGGFSLVFDSLPLPDAEGRIMLLMTEADQDRRRGESASERGGYDQSPTSGAPAGGRGGMDDEIPFLMEWR